MEIDSKIMEQQTFEPKSQRSIASSPSVELANEVQETYEQQKKPYYGSAQRGVEILHQTRALRNSTATLG